MSEDKASLFGVSEKGMMILIRDAGLEISEEELKRRIRKIRSAWKPPSKEMVSSRSDNMDNVQYIMEKFECPICGQRFPDVWLAFGHMSDKHTAEEQAKDIRSCKTCDRYQECAGNDSGVYPCPDYIERIE